MNLHEYQGKALFKSYGLPVPDGCLVKTIDEARNACLNLGGDQWVIKAQVHAGGRGKAGGVRLVNGLADAEQFVKSLLGTRLVTYQTDAAGQPIDQLLIEPPSIIERELYVGAVIDRTSGQLVIMASTEGGMEIEKVASESPSKIITTPVHPMVGLQPFQGRKLAFSLGLEGEQIKQFCSLAEGLARMFIENDLSLVEINPLVVTPDKKLLCIDAKINVDDNALYRHTSISSMRDHAQEDDREVHAREWDLNYIALDGDIGCMVNGAGLAMATMDLIKLHGGNPANFLDVGGTATKERVAEAFKIILSDSNVKGVLVNIFGGIVRCDLIADGIIAAVNEVGINVPVVVRLEGNNAALGLEIISKSGASITAVQGLDAAARTIVTTVAETL